MPYVTTRLQQLKSYPTYQFYAHADSKKLNIDDTFKVCILETFKWLRSRLKEFKHIPDDVIAIEPENYSDFSDEMLKSFSYSNGLSIDVVYIEKKGIWSFRLSESDMGANIGSANERLPVQGRTFNTEFTYRKQKDYVEIGVRTICSEPSDSTVDCEVFRPTVVKALSENKNIRLEHCGFILDGNPIEVKSKNEYERFISVYENEKMNFPVILVADSKTETKMPELPKTTSFSSFNLGGSLYSGKSMDVSIDAGKLNLKSAIPVTKGRNKDKKEKTPEIQPKPVTKKFPLFEYSELAKKLVGFAVVAFVDEKFFKQIENKTGIKLDFGDIVIVRHQSEIERHHYDEYADDMKAMFKSIRKEMILMPKRKSYYFGDILFHSDAKLQEYKTKRHETNSLEEQCSIYRLENEELKNQIKEQSQHQNDMQQISETLRLTQKKLEVTLNELEKSRNEYHELLSDTKKREEAYRKSSNIVSFYKEQIRCAALFPTHKDEVCDWIEENYSDYIVISQRAKSEMRKYDGVLDVAALCDGIVFLKAYSQYRNNEILESTLNLYAEQNNWEVQGSGKEALKMRKSDYTVSHQGEQYLLDLHIKRGVKSEELIRVYFCWLENEHKLLIGSMPEHLATVKQST